MVVGHVASVAGLEFGPLGFAEEEERGGGAKPMVLGGEKAKSGGK